MDIKGLKSTRSPRASDPTRHDIVRSLINTHLYKFSKITRTVTQLLFSFPLLYNIIDTKLIKRFTNQLVVLLV